MTPGFGRVVRAIVVVAVFAAAAGLGAWWAYSFARALEAPDAPVVEAKIAAAVAGARVDTVTVTVERLVERHRVDTLWRLDTIYHLGPEPRLAVPVSTVQRMDSTVRACSELATACAVKRQADSVVIARLEERVGFTLREKAVAVLAALLAYLLRGL